MKSFQTEAALDYPVHIVFSYFADSAKNSFPCFQEDSPIGVYSIQKGNKRFKAEITAYEKNKVYEIRLGNRREYSIVRYELYPIDECHTRLCFIETESERNFFGKINQAFTFLLFGKRQPDEFLQFIKSMQNTLNAQISNKENPKEGD